MGINPSPSPSSTSSPLNLELTPFTVQFELIALTAMSYTSLRDLMPSSPGSQSFEQIPIKNRLVKHAAWAYLQPMLESPEPNGGCFADCVDGCLGFVHRKVLPKIQRAIHGVFSGLKRKRNKEV